MTHPDRENALALLTDWHRHYQDVDTLLNDIKASMGLKPCTECADYRAMYLKVRDELAALQQAQQTTEPELPEAVAIRHSFDGYGYLYTDSGSGSLWKERAGCMPDAECEGQYD